MLAKTASHFSIFPGIDIDTLNTWLEKPRKIVITTHKNPDGDAIGSSVGLWWVLKKLGHDVTVITPNAHDHFLAWIPGSNSIFNAWRNMAKAKKMFSEAELIFCLDFSASKRVGELQEMLDAATGKKIMVDHHIDPEDWANLMFHVEGISSTAELIYRLVVQMGHENLIDKAVAESLYTGLMTDTGSFRFSSTTSDVHRIVAELLDKGLDVGGIHNKVYDNFRETRLRFLGYLLYEKLQVLPKYKTAYMTITIEEIKRFKVKSGDTDGIVNYGLSLKGINFTVLMKETPEGTKMSFRSIGQFPCNKFASNFNGGGHHNASGGKNDDGLPETEQKFLNLLEEFQPLLAY